MVGGQISFEISRKGPGGPLRVKKRNIQGGGV